MLKFQIIEILKDIKLDPKRWHDVPTPTDVIVDKTGKSVTSDFAGRQYKLIVRERTFSQAIHVGRCLLGIVAVICTLGIVLFSESVRNLFHKKLIEHFGINISKIIPELELDLHLGHSNEVTLDLPLSRNNIRSSRCLPESLGLITFSYLSGRELGQCSSVSKDFAKFTSREMIWNCTIKKIAIGKDKWSFLNEINIKGEIGIGDEPPLPSNIYHVLSSPSPSSPNKTVGQTHKLVLMPNFIRNLKILKNELYAHATYILIHNITKRRFKKDDDLFSPTISTLDARNYSKSFWLFIKKG